MPRGHLRQLRSPVLSGGCLALGELQRVKHRSPRRRRPRNGLSIYKIIQVHHACVLLMAWGYVEYHQTLAFGGLVANTFVHVVMYYYYFRAALKLETPWKAWVTRLQILQFSVSFLLLLVTLVL